MNTNNFLLVEDDDSHAKLMMLVFEKNSLPVKINRVKDGESAIRYLRKENEFRTAKTPSAILLDLNIPGIDGLEVLKIIKGDEELRPIPVIILTTSNSLVDKEKAYLHYANSYLVKPIRAKDFQTMIASVEEYWGKWNTPPAPR